MRGRRLAVLALAAGSLAALALVLAAVLLRGGEEDEAAAPAGPLAVRLDRCAEQLDAERRDCWTRELQRTVDAAEDLQAGLAQLNRTVRAAGPPLLGDCHGLMHTVGRAYARAREVEVASLMDYLPRTNDPGCPAGFAHGLVTAVAPQIDPRDPRAAAAVCGRAATRFQRYSCTHGFGHAFMRIYDDRLAPALALCRLLGPGTAPDCAQGAFHDYWFAVIGVDDTTPPPEVVTSPRELCGAQRAEFVRPCWYRAFVDTRPPGFVLESAADLDGLCADLAGVQRAGCITAASVIGPPDPALQLRICADLAVPADAVSCIHGTKVQNIIGRPLSTYVGLIGGCDAFAGAVGGECYRWLGKTLAVITDGRFGREGCPQLGEPAATRACRDGARRIDEPLETFS